MVNDQTQEVKERKLVWQTVLMDESRKIIMDMDTLILKPGDCILVRPKEGTPDPAVRQLIRMFERAKDQGHYPQVDMIILNHLFECSVLRKEGADKVTQGH